MDDQPRRSGLDWILQGLRAAALLPVRSIPAGPSPWSMLLIVGLATAIATCASRLEVDGPATFDLYSWLTRWAPDALLIFGAWLVLSWARASSRHASPVAAWYLLLAVAAVPVSLAGTAVAALESRGYVPDWWWEGWQSWAIYGALSLWFVAATWRISQAVTRSKLAVAGLVACVLAVVLLAASQLPAGSWQPVGNDSGDEIAELELSQEVFESQQALLNDELRAIAPSEGGKALLYGLIYAPYDEDVFLRESAMVQQVLEERFGARRRIVRLVNNSATAGELPWATTLNFKRSIRALAEAMDTGRDVLVVYLTSHGGADFTLAALNWPLKVEELTANQLREMLDEAGIRLRVIAVSACYSGGWIGPLQDEDTLVMTAADEDHTSYGCGSGSELTFFGRAVFDEQLRKSGSFEEAFRAAVPVIRQREIEVKKDDGFSNPQIHVGRNIRSALSELAQ
jgi:peptidase C13-like protein